MLRVPGFEGGPDHCVGCTFGGAAAGGEQGGEGALVEMERVGLRCANPTYRVDVDLLVVENLFQRVGFQYPVGPDVYFLGGGLLQALMYVVRQGAEAVSEQTD